MKNLNVYIPTCDPHLFVIEGFAYFFNKYWGDDFNVKVLGFSEPDFELPPNFEFISMAKEQVGRSKGWSNYIIDFFESIDDEHFIFGIDDFYMARPFDREVYETLLKEISDEKVGRIDLQPSIQHCRNPEDVSVYKEFDDFKILELRQISVTSFIFRITGQFSIWNREYFLKNIQRDWTVHQWELIGGKLAEGDGYKILGTADRWCAKKIELVSDNQYPGKLNVFGMREEDINKVKELYSNRPEEIGNFKTERAMDIIYGE
ncbi:MAG TPA: hypothetical protein DF712_23325 [Balneola sp.]|nr:hypothetical protein [Balneola sp.]